MANENELRHVVGEVKAVSRITVGQEVKAQQIARRLDNIEIILLNLRSEFMLMQENNHDHDWPMPAEEAAGVPWSKFDFGYTRINKTQFTIHPGEIQIGFQAAVATASLAVTIGANNTYIGWEYVIGTKVLSIINFGTSITQEATKIKRWL